MSGDHFAQKEKCDGSDALCLCLVQSVKKCRSGVQLLFFFLFFFFFSLHHPNCFVLGRSVQCGVKIMWQVWKRERYGRKSMWPVTSVWMIVCAFVKQKKRTTLVVDSFYRT